MLSIRSLGSLRFRDFGRALFKSQRLREAEGPEAAIACLEDALDKVTDGDEARQDLDSDGCRILLAECRIESGLARQDAARVLAGMQTLARADTQFRSYFMVHTGSLRPILTKLAACLETILQEDWVPATSKGAFRDVAAQVASAWCNAHDPGKALALCEMALGFFPNDPNLLLCLAEACAGRGELPACLQHAKLSLAAAAIPEHPGKIIGLMERLIRGPEPVLAAEARALAGEVFRRVGRWDQAVEALTRAQEVLGDDLEEFAVEALLVACLQRRAYDDLAKHGLRYARRGFSQERMARVATAVRETLEGYPERELLWLLWAELSRHLSRLDDALRGLRRALSLDTTLAEQVMTVCRALPKDASGHTSARLGLAQAMFNAGQPRFTLEVLEGLDVSAATAEEVLTATGLYREATKHAPDLPQARQRFLDLLLNQNALEEVLVAARETLAQTGNAEAAAALSWKVGGAAHLAGNTRTGLAARQFEIEAWLQTGDLDSALEALQVLGQHSIATPEAVLWAMERLRELAASPPHSTRARLAIAHLLRSTGRIEESAAEYLGILEDLPTPGVLDAACAGLTDVLPSVSGRERMNAPLARGWLKLGRPSEAREPLLAALGSPAADRDSLLNLLKDQTSAAPESDEWLGLGIEAALAVGDEVELSVAARSLDRLLDICRDRAAWVAEAGHRLCTQTTNPETLQCASLAQVRAHLVAGDDAGLQQLCLDLAEKRPLWIGAVCTLLQEAVTTATAPASTQLQALLDLLAPPAVETRPPVTPPAESPTPPQASATDEAPAPSPEVSVPEPSRARGRRPRSLRDQLATELVAASSEAPAAVPAEPSAGPTSPAEPQQPDPPLAETAPPVLPAGPRLSRSARAREALRNTLANMQPPAPALGAGFINTPVRNREDVPGRPVVSSSPQPTEPISIGAPSGCDETAGTPAGPPKPVVPGTTRASRKSSVLLEGETVELEGLASDHFLVDMPATPPQPAVPAPPASAPPVRSALQPLQESFKEVFDRAVEAFLQKEYGLARELMTKAGELRPDDAKVRYNLSLIEKKLAHR